jgi:MFS family permease
MLDLTMKRSFRKYSLLLIIASFVIYLLQAVMVNDTMNIYYHYFPILHNWTRTQIALPLTIGMYLTIPVVFFIGTLLIRVDVRKILVPSIVIMGICTIVIGRTSSYPVYMTAFVISTQASKGMLLSAYVVCTNWYITTRGRTLGIVTMGCPVGSALYVAIMMRIIEATGNLPLAHTVWGIVIILFGAVAGFMLRGKPEDVGLQPDGIRRGEDEIVDLRKNPEATQWPLNRLVRNPEAWFLVIGWGGLFIIMTGFMSIFVVRLLELGVTLPMALNFLTLSAVIGIGLSYLWGYIDDKKGAHKASVGLAAGYFFMSVAMLVASNGNMIFIVIAVIGLSCVTGGLPNLNPSLVAYVYGRRDFMPVNRWLLVAQGMMAAPAAIFFNWIYDTRGNYNAVYLICSIVAMVSMVSFLMIKKTYDPERLAIKEAVK